MKVFLSCFFWLISINITQAAWKIECEIVGQKKEQSVVNFASNYKLRDTQTVKFGNKELYVKLSKAVVSKKSHISIRNYSAKTKNTMERLWSVGKYIDIKKLASNPFQVKFKTNDNKEGTFKCKGL